MSRSKIAIRADGGCGIGFGHIMRTAPIAMELRRKGVDAIYICSDDAVRGVMEDLGIPCIILDSDRSNLIAEMPKIENVIEHSGVNFVLVDTFSANNEYFKGLSKFCRVGAMAYGKRFTEALDLVISYSPLTDFEWYARTFSERTRLLLGAKYTPLRPGFARSVERDYCEPVTDVFIAAGGEDRLGACAALIETMTAERAWDNVTFHVVSNVRLVGMCESPSDRVKFYSHLDGCAMADLMGHCDLAITASGNTVYELAALGVPMIAFATSDEQVEQGNKGEFLLWLGDIRDETRVEINKAKVREISSVALSIADSPRERERLGFAAKAEGIDGNGAERIAEEIQRLLLD